MGSRLSGGLVAGLVNRLVSNTVKWVKREAGGWWVRVVGSRVRCGLSVLGG